MKAAYNMEFHEGVVCLYDLTTEGEGFLSKSITNDAEDVIEAIGKQKDIHTFPVIYKDTEGNWDQLCVNTLGQFSHFGFLDTTDLQTAVKRAAPPPKKAA